MSLRSDLKKFCGIALKLGAFATKPIPTSDIVVDDWVRLKCQFGCGEYNRRFYCPPNTPTPAQTRKILEEYDWAILIGFSLPLGPYKDVEQYDPFKALVQRKLFAIERAAFLDGYYKAFCFSSGACMLCYPKKCRMKNPISNVSDLIRFRFFARTLHCRNPTMARPAMEGCGIDVFATVRKAGLPLQVLTSRKEFPQNYGLLQVA